MNVNDDRFYLLHIRDACDFILDFTRGGEDAFRGDPRSQHAVIRNLQVVGEAAKKVSEGMKQAHPQVPWRDIAGMRDRLVHGYFQINIDIVWEAVHKHIPLLRQRVATILESLMEEDK